MKRSHIDRIIDAALSYFQPKSEETAREWCERNIVLTSAHGQYPGPLSLDLTPWIIEPLECICRDHTLTDIALMFGSQLAKTLLLMLSKCYILVNSPRDILFMMPNKDMAGSYSEERWQPLVEACPPLAERITSDRDKYRKHDMYYTAAWLNLVGSNSPANIASRARPVIFQDETDKTQGATAKETSASRNADKRSKTFANPKRVKTSTPTDENGVIYKEFMAADQREFEVACPYCGKYIEQLMEQIKWSPNAKVDGKWDIDQVKATAYYKCQHCEGRITDGHKTAMNRNWRWTPRNPDAPSHRASFHAPSWIAPWPETSYGHTAAKYLEAQASFDMQDFDTNERGMPYVIESTKVSWELLAARREPYTLGSIPDQAAVLTAFCDVQDTWLEWFVWGWGEGMENWVVEHEVMHGDTSKPDVWEALKITILQERDLPLDWTFIDYGGHRGQESIEFARAMSSHKVYLHFGSKNIDCPVNGRKTKTKKPITELYETGVGNAKRWTLSALLTGMVGPGYCHFPAALDEEFFKQLCAERLQPKKGMSGEKEWKKIRARNEAADGFAGCYAAYKRLNKGLLKRRYDALNERRKIAAPAQAEAAPTAQPPALIAPPKKKKKKNVRRRTSSGWMGGYN